jgi:hypothetical protein
MRIGLIDVDGGKFPNLALMKLSAYHKNRGDLVEWVNPFYAYDKVYMSKVFTFSEDYNTCLNAKEVIKGGVGYDLENKLTFEVEHQYPDYDLYSIQNTAYGFLTRGCPRQCSFCNVSEHQGNQSVKVSDLKEFWNGQKNIVLLDPNITACKEWRELFEQLIESKAYIDFTQGIDARTLTEEKIEHFQRMKLKHLHFALDNPKDTDLIIKKLSLLKSITNWNRSKVSVYVLTNYGSTHEQDLDRIYKIKELGFSPYVMIYEKETAPVITRKLARYVNNKFIFWSKDCLTFDDYMKL